MWNLLAQSDEATGMAVVFGSMLMNCAITIGIWVVFGLALSTIAKKLGVTENLWMAWVPIANVVMMVQLAELEIWWVVLTILCGLPGIYVWMKIAERRGKPNWTALLMLIPCVGFFVPLWIAYTD